ncbi:MAG: 2-oxo acid dehydrogenase subunit E2, partial [Pseudobacteriovorax sp.]|nr:2-oxo acid dehydrogenase subunit E2 [Pseudobacteriovorax sp.]
MGIEQFTAIINPPQAAILAVGATVKTPWVAEDGSITVQSRMTFTMSCDHRAIDGALGAEFLQTLAAYIEDKESRRSCHLWEPSSNYHSYYVS